jgi:hypothetical protein
LSNINDILGIKYLLYLIISLTIHSKVSFVLSAFLDNDFVGTSCEGTFTGLFIMINSLLLIVVNNLTWVDLQKPIWNNRFVKHFKFILYLSNYLHICISHLVFPLPISNSFSFVTGVKNYKNNAWKNKLKFFFLKQDKICNLKTWTQRTWTRTQDVLNKCEIIFS